MTQITGKLDKIESATKNGKTFYAVYVSGKKYGVGMANPESYGVSEGNTVTFEATPNAGGYLQASGKLSVVTPTGEVKVAPETPRLPVFNPQAARGGALHDLISLLTVDKQYNTTSKLHEKVAILEAYMRQFLPTFEDYIIKGQLPVPPALPEKATPRPEYVAAEEIPY